MNAGCRWLVGLRFASLTAAKAVVRHAGRLPGPPVVLDLVPSVLYTPRRVHATPNYQVTVGKVPGFQNHRPRAIPHRHSTVPGYMNMKFRYTEFQYR